ncbi:hypothetical protein HA464_01350 [Rhizobium leguminosarum bv. trifolii]|nr:hypothetical protein HA464_01350 [Rhizobium leguminosarum bv. trifolii]
MPLRGGRGGKRRLAVVDIADRQLAGGILGSPLPAAPASTVARSSVTVASTTIEAASLAPVMATTMLWLAVPSSELTLSVSLTASPWLSACVAARLLSSV